ncbi:UDP-N-acetylglucosamine--dolichyl-phosphate N-acetylglucosaminephosphotransferase [Yarrowia sp. B02]|nr:UDP-N-acetylglucosamine--dolichyl-phosphate N-acetylglucosaminephosphotransferase [Yarrowia sp. B02]
MSNTKHSPSNTRQNSRKMYSSIWTVLATVALSAALVFNPADQPLLSSVGFSLIAYLVTYNLIPALGPAFIKVGFSGRDLSKKDRPEIPETMGAVCAIVYLFCMFLFIPFVFYQYLAKTIGGGVHLGYDSLSEGLVKGRILSSFPHEKLAEYLSAILCLQSMFILGVADDLFDIRWRNKFFLPAIAAIPLLIVYYVDFGITAVMVPVVLRPYFGDIVDLGALYYGYMAAVAIFCPNSINIYAGVNGLEVGQSVMIGVCILLNDFIYLVQPNHPAEESHLFSVYLLLPFLAVSIALLRHNWCPARCFVGDTYCYFAGMVFAVVGILGHFSKTLLLFFVPQIFNFLYSVPQLFKIVDCPRHRLPKFNPETGLLEPSRAYFDKKKPGKLGRIMIYVLEKLHLLKVWRDEKGEVTSISNMTLINLVLVYIGPLQEDHLAAVLLGIQFVSGLAAIALRHSVAAMIFGRDNI